MSIFDVQHQPRAHRILQQALACERMPHAYLFAGPEGVGKETLAMHWAQMLICSSPVEITPPDEEVGVATARQACGICEDCNSAIAGTHPDISLVYRQLNRQHPDTRIRKQKALNLSVDVIRYFLIDRAGTHPSRGRAKVFIVREAERLGDGAQNALLKTLEEPPAKTFIILLASALDRMLPTTRSRCQQVAFQTLPVPFVESRLKTLRPDSDPAAQLFAARHSGGSLGKALQQLDDGVHAIKQTWGQQLATVVSGDPRVAPNEFAKPLLADAQALAKFVLERDPDASDTDAARQGLRELFSVMGDFFLDAMRVSSGAAVSLVNADQPKVVEAIARRLDTAGLQRGLKQLAEAEANLASNANTELTLETLFIRLSRSRTSRASV